MTKPGTDPVSQDLSVIFGFLRCNKTFNLGFLNLGGGHKKGAEWAPLKELCLLNHYRIEEIYSFLECTERIASAKH